MVSAMLTRTAERTGHEAGVAHGEGIGSGPPHEREVDSTGLSQGGDPRGVESEKRADGGKGETGDGLFG